MSITGREARASRFLFTRGCLRSGKSSPRHSLPAAIIIGHNNAVLVNAVGTHPMTGFGPVCGVPDFIERIRAMPHQVELKYAVLTDTGMVRSQNEDAVEVRPAHSVVVLADGMGGYRAGEVASRIATQDVADGLEKSLAGFDWSVAAERAERLARLMSGAVEHANQVIFEQAQRDPQHYAGMGTTLVSTLFHHDKLVVAHVGDSRAYRLRDNRLEQITRDHSQVQEQVDAGLLSKQQARFASNRNLVTRALGIDLLVDVEVHEHATRPGDLYLLCSDGLCDMLDDAEIARLLGTSQESLEAVAASLIQHANALGGLDNITVALIQVVAVSGESTGILGRMLDWVR